jgi:hypothetical protein
MPTYASLGSFLGYIVSGPMKAGAMYCKLFPDEVESRYLADPTSDFAIRLREHVELELLPPLRQTEMILQDFKLLKGSGGSLEQPSNKFFTGTLPPLATPVPS